MSPHVGRAARDLAQRAERRAREVRVVLRQPRQPPVHRVQLRERLVVVERERAGDDASVCDPTREARRTREGVLPAHRPPENAGGLHAQRVEQRRDVVRPINRCATGSRVRLHQARAVGRDQSDAEVARDVVEGSDVETAEQTAVAVHHRMAVGPPVLAEPETSPVADVDRSVFAHCAPRTASVGRGA
jgi:hypothetical protein